MKPVCGASGELLRERKVGQRETMADFLFIARVNVIGLSEIDRHRHARARHFERAELPSRTCAQRPPSNVTLRAHVRWMNALFD